MTIVVCAGDLRAGGEGMVHGPRTGHRLARQECQAYW